MGGRGRAREWEEVGEYGRRRGREQGGGRATGRWEKKEEEVGGKGE